MSMRVFAALLALAASSVAMAADNLAVYGPCDNPKVDQADGHGMTFARLDKGVSHEDNFGWTQQDPKAASLVWSDNNPLVYPGLASTPGHLTNNGTAAGHFVNSTATPDLAWSGNDDGGAFSGFGKPGTTVWVSLLVRPEKPGATEHIDFGMNMAVVSWYDEAPMFYGHSKGDYKRFGVGSFGERSLKNGRHYWTVAGETPDQKAAYAVSDKEVEAGKTTLLVFRIDYVANGGDVTLYVNPTLPTKDVTAKADATVHFTGNQVMSNFSWNGTGPTSLDELRIGGTFAAVTPGVAASQAAAEGH